MKHFFLMAISFLFSLPAFAGEGYLKLKANVEGVQILVGSKTEAIGTEWSMIILPSGSYDVEASKQDYQTQTKQIHIANGRVVTLNFKFKKPSSFKVEKPKDVAVVKGYGDLTIVTDIPGATIRLNGQSVSGEVAPMTVKELAEGLWRVEATLNGKIQQKEIHIKPNELTMVRFFFDPENLRKHEETLRKLREEKAARETLRQKQEADQRALKERQVREEKLLASLSAFLDQDHFDSALDICGILKRSGTASGFEKAVDRMIRHMDSVSYEKNWEKIHYAFRAKNEFPKNERFKLFFEEKKDRSIGSLSASPGKTARGEFRDIHGRTHEIILSGVHVSERKIRGVFSGKTNVESASCKVSIDGNSITLSETDYNNTYSLELPEKSVSGFVLEASGRRSKSTSGLVDGVLNLGFGAMADAVSYGKAGYIKDALTPGEPSISLRIALDI